MTSTVGVIGPGAMGSGMAQSLRRAGRAAHVFDLRPGVAAAMAAKVYKLGDSAGYAREDDSAVIKIFPGIELPKGKQ